MTSISPEIVKQLLPRPPRPRSDGGGYDWQEFDRWLQRVYALIGVPQSSKAFNLVESTCQTVEGQLDLDFATNNHLEVQLLRQMVEQLSTEVHMLTDQQQNVTNLSRKLDDLYVELGVS